MSNIVTIGGVSSPVISYKGRAVCTSQQLAQFYECTEKNLSDNFAYQRARFEEGKHFIKLEGEQLRAFKDFPENSGSVGPRAASVMLWTARGAARHAKMLTTPKAWEVFEEMEDVYFTASSRRTPAPVSPIKQASEAARAFPALYKVARLIGCDKNAAAISANQAVQKFSSVNLLEGLGQKHLEAANQESKYWTPTELGARIGMSGQGVNKALAAAGLQIKRGKEWDVTDAGKAHARIYDTGKSHNSGVPVVQIKWADSALPLIASPEAA